MKNLNIISALVMMGVFTIMSQHNFNESLGQKILAGTSKEPKIASNASVVKMLPQTSLGTIKGKITFKGKPVQKVKNIIKDEHTCGAHDIVDESLLTSADGGLQWAVVSIVSEIKNKKPLSSLAGKKVLDQSGCVFQPHVVLVGVNQELTFINSDPTLHNVRTISMFNDIFNKAQIYLPGNPAPKDVVTFSEPEIIESVCDVHGWMKAYIHVVDHPYHTVTDEGGEYELTDVPPGKYTVRVWHETQGVLEKTVTVSGDRITSVNLEI